MAKTDFVPGSASIKDLVYWMEERHAIWRRRFKEKLPRDQWTDDPILKQYSFTNVFRELDRGTVYLNDMLARGKDELDEELVTPGMILFNIYWYRMFNWYEHATELGFVLNFEDLEKYIERRFVFDQKIFTSAHLTAGKPGENKYESTLNSCRAVWNMKDELAAVILEMGSIRDAFEQFLQFSCCGKFIGYEVATDVFHHLIPHAYDRYDWANVGPGSKRGMERLGIEPTIENMSKLFFDIYEELDELQAHHPFYTRKQTASLLEEKRTQKRPFMTLREVEHSLCEFDKYQRVLRGEGRPRENYKTEHDYWSSFNAHDFVRENN